MRSNDSINKCGNKKQQSEQSDKFPFNTIRIYITIYHTYLLIYCKRHIQMRSNDSIINVEIKNNRVSKVTSLHSIQLEFTLQYITLTCYYIVKDTFRWWIIKTPMWKEKVIECEQKDKIAINTIRIYITIYHTYWLLYCKTKDIFRWQVMMAP